MTDRTLERIEDDAIKYTNQETGYQVLPEHFNWIAAYIAGAKSERNKAIDDCIQVLENNPGDMNLVPLLESLKL